LPLALPKPKDGWNASLERMPQRLVIELRLANATSLEQANSFLQEYLPRFNARFAVPAEQEETAYQPRPSQMKIPELFCFKYERTVGADHVVREASQRLQVQPDQVRRTSAHAKVEVQERLDGSLAIYSQGRCLKITPAPPEAPLLRTRSGPRKADPAPASSTHELPSDAASASKQEKPAQRVTTGSGVSNPDSPWRKAPMIVRRT
jgi:hypothetical protein